MAYDEDLADRIREIVATEPGLTEKKMFGGVAFLINGHLAVSASGQEAMLLRVDPALTASLLERGRVRRFEMRGRELNGWLHVDRSVVDTEGALRHWVAFGVDYARSLAPKERG